MRDALDDDETGGRPLLWMIFAMLLVVLIAAVAIVWRHEGFGGLTAWLGTNSGTTEAGPAVHAGDIGGTAAREPIGDWFVSCGAPAAGCGLTQTVGPEGGGMPKASWRIERTQGGELIGIWTLPTGIMIGRGMQLSLDDGKPSVVPYDSCAQNSCEVRAKFGPDFIELMRAAKKTGATVTLKGGASQTYGFSHDGLAAGLMRMAKSTAP